MSEDRAMSDPDAFWKGRCLDCAHPKHEMTCHEMVPNGDPSNGPAYCPCAANIELMEQEIVRLRAAPRAATPDPQDILLVANAILGSTSYLPHREAAERLLAAPRAATKPSLTRERLAAALHDGDLAPRAFGEGFVRPLMCKTMPSDRCVNRAQHEAAAESILAALATPPSAPLEETRDVDR